MTTSDRPGFDPSGQAPLDPAQLSALASRLYAQLSGVTSAPTPQFDGAPTRASEIPVPATVPTAPEASSAAAIAERVAGATLRETRTLPAGRGSGSSPRIPEFPFVSGLGEFAVPDVTSLLRHATTDVAWWGAPPPEPFALGEVQRTGALLQPGAPASHERLPAAYGRLDLFDVATIRRDFPVLDERVNGHRLVWLDNAATTQKPVQVTDRLTHFYHHENSNIHRAAHELAARATDAYEEARESVRRFIGAGSPDSIVFVRGTTEAINLVAQSWGGTHIGAGDEIVITHLEHHANIVPWQMLAQRTGAVLRVAPVDESGTLDLAAFEGLLGPRTKLVSATHVSNALGTVTPIRQIVELGHRYGARVLIDAAQSVAHLAIDVRELGVDFLVFSGHKVFGPTGIGVLYGTEEAFAETPPWQGGGNMIADVTLERTVFHGPPNKFEAGTGNIADAVGLGAALRYVESIGLANIARHEHELLEYATPRLAAVSGVRLVGTSPEKTSVLSFVLDGHDTLTVGQRLNEVGIAVRAGHHCAQPILRRLGLEATVRPSFAFYNTFEEVDRLVEAAQWISQHPA